MAQSGQLHARLRRLVSRAFTPRQVERLRPRLRAYLARLWQDIAQTGRCDVVTSLARPLPSMAIAELLGVPGDAALLARWSASLQAVFDMDMTAKRASELLLNQGTGSPWDLSRIDCSVKRRHYRRGDA